MRAIDADALEKEGWSLNRTIRVDKNTSEYQTKPLRQVPTIEPRNKGHWIKISPANIYECSECGKNVMTDDISAYDFCHGCGAEMKGENGCLNT